MIAIGRPLRRRTLLGGAGALATLNAARAGSAAPVIGAQVFIMIQEAMRDLPGALRRLAAAGCTEVEMMAGLATPAATLAALSAAGLGCRSVHVPPYPMAPGMPSLQDFDGALDYARTLNVRYVVCSFPLVPPAQRVRLDVAARDPDAFGRAILSMDDAAWDAHLRFLNQTGARFAQAGFRLAYHNHAPDFAPAGGGTRYDQTMARTDPRLVCLELDCGWAIAAGADPLQLMARAPGRFRLLHLKDVAPGQAPSITGHTRTVMPMGNGVLDWRAIIAAARRDGVEAMFIEQEPPYDRPPDRLAADSLRYLRNLAD